MLVKSIPLENLSNSRFDFFAYGFGIKTLPIVNGMG